MKFYTIKENNISVSEIVKNSHFVIYNNCKEAVLEDDVLRQELLKLGISSSMIRTDGELWNHACYYVEGEVNPIYHCATLYPFVNITVTYPFFNYFFYRYCILVKVY